MAWASFVVPKVLVCGYFLTKTEFGPADQFRSWLHRADCCLNSNHMNNLQQPEVVLLNNQPTNKFVDDLICWLSSNPWFSDFWVLRNRRKSCFLFKQSAFANNRPLNNSRCIIRTARKQRENPYTLYSCQICCRAKKAKWNWDRIWSIALSEISSRSQLLCALT